MKKEERFEDMSSFGQLVVFQQDDGDMIVRIIPDPVEGNKSAEFCTPFGGGGQSPNTHKALVNLMEAMEKDNQTFPQDRTLGCSVGDKVEVDMKYHTRTLVDGVLVRKPVQLWLTKILPLEKGSKIHWWEAKYTRASHRVRLCEDWILRKISSDFEGFDRREKEDG